MSKDKNEANIGQVKYLLNKLRYITLAVQILPFIYSFLYIFSLVLYLICDESILRILDTLFYVSPIVVCGFLVESHILKLCKWHKSACILPILPQAIVFIDAYIVELTSIEAHIAIITPIVLSVLLLIAAYHVFIK